MDFMVEREGKYAITELSPKGFNTALIISSMDSNGLDYVMYAKNPENKKIYGEYGMQCKNHNGC
ncbi:hypothetical protein COV17_03450 [Candidatus Woesearchaeota archaeon CG10_big_fil_rev_8_21_14_0_10_36_11]|nr:MAG: hypothetical protein COV17_03450 [Candidatus Woesearchaeota archaeon CG10_big_fil_rev_8_21_14_0_10_36_11]